MIVLLRFYLYYLYFISCLAPLLILLLLACQHISGMLIYILCSADVKMIARPFVIFLLLLFFTQFFFIEMNGCKVSNRDITCSASCTTSSAEVEQSYCTFSVRNASLVTPYIFFINLKTDSVDSEDERVNLVD